MGSTTQRAQNGDLRLNTSVLTKMPRDCTAQPYGCGGCTVRVLSVDPILNNNCFPHLQTHDMAGNKRNNSRANAPSSRPTTANQQKTKGQRVRGGNPPTAVATRGLTPSPKVVGGVGGARITHTEYIGDVATSSTGAVSTYTINASNPNTFPWLSRIAQGYELYRFRRLRIDYSPSCSSSTSGVVVGAFEFDANDPVPQSKQQISAIDGAARVNIWNQTSFQFKPLDNWCFCAAANSAPGDLRLSDVARFFIATFGTNSSGTVVGDLTVTYDVEFTKPEMASSVLTEYVQPIASTLSALAGTSSSIAGDKIFNLASPSVGKLDLSFNYGGQFMLVFFGYGPASSEPAALFAANTELYRNDIITPGTFQVLEGTTTRNVNSLIAYATYVMSVNVAVGDILRLYAAAAFTGLAIQRIRATPYKYAIA